MACSARSGTAQVGRALRVNDMYLARCVWSRRRTISDRTVRDLCDAHISFIKPAELAIASLICLADA